MLRDVFVFQLVLAGFTSSACLDNRLEPDDAPRVFICQQEDFASYKEWTKYESDVMDDHAGVLGKNTIYLAELPEHGAHVFSVGAIAVKVTTATDSDEVLVHAMCKRGGGYNTDGALGWEYVELTLDKRGAPFIQWRGSKPPSGEQYQQLPGAKMSASDEQDCNSCHAHGDTKTKMEAKDGMLGADIIELLN